MLSLSSDTFSNGCGSLSESSFVLHDSAYKNENEEIKSFWKMLCSVSTHQQPELRYMSDGSEKRSTGNISKVTRVRVNKKTRLGFLLLLGAVSCKVRGISDQKEGLLLPHKNGLLPKKIFDGGIYPFPTNSPTMVHPSDAGKPYEGESYLLALSEMELSSVITFLEHFFPPLSYIPIKRKREQRSENDLSMSAKLFSDIYDRANLPVKDKTILLGVLNAECLKFEQKSGIDIDDYSNALMVVDMLFLALGEKNIPFRTYYQRMGALSRQQLSEVEDNSIITQYIEETPPHLSFRRTTINFQDLMERFEIESKQYPIIKSDYLTMNSTGLANVITRVCDKYFHVTATHFPPPTLNKYHNVMFGHNQLGGGRYYSPKAFTSMEIYLGAHMRYASDLRDSSFFFPKEINHFVYLVCSAKPSISDCILKELNELLYKLKSNSIFQNLFESTLDFRAIGILIRKLEGVSPLDVPLGVHHFLNGRINPQLIILKGEVIPNLLALSTVSDSRIVYISLAYSEVKIVDRFVFDDDFELFIRKHLSIFDSQRLPKSGLKPQLMCNPDIYRDVHLPSYCLKSVLDLRYVDEYQNKIYSAFLQRVEKDINSVVYTKDEYVRDLRLLSYKDVLVTMGVVAGILSVAATGPFGAAILATVGVATGLGEIAINLQHASVTDDGSLYENMLFEAKLGAAFLAFGTVADVIDVGRLSSKKLLAHYQTKSRKKVTPYTKGNKSKRYGMTPRGKVLYKESPDFTAIKVRGDKSVGQVGYRTLADNHYVQLFTKSDDVGKQQASKNLVISAHGGYIAKDIESPPVILPADITITLLTPHNTRLFDPGIEDTLNSVANFEAFLTIDGKEIKTNFQAQNHNQWKHSSNYQPDAVVNSLGRTDGLQNYRHFHYEQESKGKLGRALVSNRNLAAEGKATLSDILIVNGMIERETMTDPKLASIQRVINLIHEGKLRNVMGEPYEKLIFSHCRCDFDADQAQVSSYRLQFPAPERLPQGSRSAKIIRSTISLKNEGGSFVSHEEDIGEIAISPYSFKVV